MMSHGVADRDVLDYGCGRRTLEKQLGFAIRNYDPCIPGLDEPAPPADVVVCTDVLEHIEPELLDNVLDDLQRVTIGVGVFTVHTGAAGKVLLDGRNAHLIQQPPSWWLPKFMERFELNTFCRTPGGFYVVVEQSKKDA